MEIIGRQWNTAVIETKHCFKINFDEDGLPKEDAMMDFTDNKDHSRHSGAGTDHRVSTGVFQTGTSRR
ncbi:hypothetical protein RvVAR0630_44660 [Agrobacterium vitis]|nr:hypothetical protein RvVAR0630_44660 [Agrobacterium vitis]